MMMTKQRRIVKSFTLDPENVKYMEHIAARTCWSASRIIREMLYYDANHSIDYETPPADMAQPKASQIGIGSSANNIQVVVGESEISCFDDSAKSAGGDDGR